MFANPYSIALLGDGRSVSISPAGEAGIPGITAAKRNTVKGAVMVIAFLRVISCLILSCLRLLRVS
jgi:hypothetical protein